MTLSRPSAHTIPHDAAAARLFVEGWQWWEKGGYPPRETDAAPFRDGYRAREAKAAADRANTESARG